MSLDYVNKISTKRSDNNIFIIIYNMLNLQLFIHQYNFNKSLCFVSV